MSPGTPPEPRWGARLLLGAWLMRGRQPQPPSQPLDFTISHLTRHFSSTTVTFFCKKNYASCKHVLPTPGAEEDT